MSLLAPTPLSPEHQVNAFACGESIFDDWLKRRALAIQASGASRTFVIADDERQVIGYYSLAAGAIAPQAGAHRSVRQGPAAPVPVMVLACLAVDVRAQGRRLGPAMLRDALQRSVLVSQNTGVRSLVVHAINENGQKFYEHYGFRTTSTHPITLMLRLDQAPAPPFDLAGQ